MKKGITLMSILLCFAVITASAQKLRLGPKVGVNFTRIDIAPAHIQPDHQSWKTGFHGGWAFNWMLSDMFSIQQEIMFIQKGNKIESNSFDTISTNLIFHNEYEEELALNYIDLPLMFRFSFGDPIDKQFFINAGPRLGFLVGGNRAWNNHRKRVVPDDPDSSEESQGQSEINENMYENAEFSFDFGVGYDINTGPGHFIIDLRWTMGISDILNEGAQSEAHLMKNQGASVSLIYLFGNQKDD